MCNFYGSFTKAGYVEVYIRIQVCVCARAHVCVCVCVCVCVWRLECVGGLFILVVGTVVLCDIGVNKLELY